MEIFHLRYFVAVAEKLSFSGAARSLHMATSPLSQRIRDLERELGTVLFERDSHHVRLTGSGTALLPIARDALSRFDDVPWRLREATGRHRPVVHLGVPPGLHSTLRERLTGFTRRCAEECELKRWPGGSRELLLGVQRGELAMAIVHLPVHAEGIEVFELMSEPLGAVLPAADFRDREAVSLHELAGLTYVRPASRMLPDYWDEIEARLSAAGIHHRMTLDTGDYGSTAEIIANGGAFAISMLDPQSGMQKLRDENITVLPVDDFSPSLATGLIWRQDRTQEQPELRTLIEHAQESLSVRAA